MRTTALLCSLPFAAILAACTPQVGKDAPVSVTPAPETSTAPATGATDQPATNPDEMGSAQCGADKLGDFVNALPNADTLNRIKALIGDKPIRVINPGDAVTMDFRADRLNIENGANGRIKQFRCF